MTFLSIAILLSPPPPIEMAIPGFELVEDLRLNADLGDAYIWTGSNTMVTSDDKGRILVLDEGENRIMVYDDKGAFERQIGRLGQGPGEFQAVESIQILADGTLFAFETLAVNATFNFFSPELTYTSRFSSLDKDVPWVPRRVVFSPNRRSAFCVATSVDQANKLERVHYMVLGPELLPVKEIYIKKEPLIDSSRLGDSSYWIDFLAPRFHNTTHGKVVFGVYDSQGLLYLASGHEYKVEVYDSSMKLLKLITRAYKPQPMSDAEVMATVEPARDGLISILPPRLHDMLSIAMLKKTIEKAEMPPVHMPVYGLIMTDRDELIVIHQIQNLTHMERGDLFDREGRYLGSFARPNYGLSKMVFRNGYAYAIERPEDDDTQVIRYRVIRGDE